MATGKTPSGAALLSACKSSLEEGFANVEGMMCSWYVTPCDCDYKVNSQVPRVCLPQAPDIDALTRIVVTGLEAHPELLNMEADMAAGTILTRHYPCSD